MTNYQVPDAPGPSTAPPRRKLLAAAALTPVLAGVTGTAVSGAPAVAAPRRQPETNGQGPIEPAATTMEDWRDVARELGRDGQMNGQFMYRTAFARDDLRVYSKGVRITPALALGTHTAFVRYVDDEVMLMGDLLIAEDELQDVHDTLAEVGIVPTAIHKHLLGHHPDVWWMHIHGHGSDAAALARGLRAALDRTSTPETPWAPETDPVDLDTERLDEIMGMSGRDAGGTYSFAFRRRETIIDSGRVLPPGLGATSAFHFQPLGGGRAALHGDFAMIADEVGPALAAARSNGIDLVTLHNHGLAESPRLFFVHLWAVDDALSIARALRPALDLTDVVPFS